MGNESDYVEARHRLCQQRRWSAAIAVTSLLCLSLISGIIFYATVRTRTTSLQSGEFFSQRPFFIFGDSYADTGNLKVGAAVNFPYGITWPGYPAGRFSDGHIQSDYLAMQVFGRPAPLPLASSTAASFSDGVNFAVGGAGETYAFGLPTISTQVSWLAALVNQGLYTKSLLASSVTLLCVVGNDYIANKVSIEELALLPNTVVALIEQNLRDLYKLGLRNIMVSTISPGNCLPVSTFLTNFTACVSNQTVEAILLQHNSLLESTLVTLSKELAGVNFVLLRLGDAIARIQSNSTAFGISEPFKQCCVGSCGQVDSFGNPFFTLCSNPSNHIFWDYVHPTQAAWKNVVNLYAEDEAFTTFAPNLMHWAQNLRSENSK